MAVPPRPVHRQVAVLCACFATFAFVAFEQMESKLRWLPMGVGLALLVVAIAALAGVRRGDSERGWLPSRDDRSTDES